MLERYVKTPIRESCSWALQLIGRKLVEIGTQLTTKETISPERKTLITLLLEPNTGQYGEALNIMRAYITWLQSEIDSFPQYDSNIYNTPVRLS